VVFAPAGIADARLRQVLDVTLSRMADITGGHEVGRWLP
jgi:hypothetical protein